MDCWLTELFEFLYESRDNERLFAHTLKDTVHTYLKDKIGKNGYVRNVEVDFEYDIDNIAQTYRLTVLFFGNQGIENRATLKIMRTVLGYGWHQPTIIDEMVAQYSDENYERQLYKPDIKAAFQQTIRNRNITIFKNNLEQS